MTIDAERITHAARSHERIQEATRRLEELRSRAERQPAGRRHELERSLDHLRGRRNRALARLEDCRLASDDAWPSARNQASAALNELLDGIAEVEHCLQRVAA